AGRAARASSCPPPAAPTGSRRGRRQVLRRADRAPRSRAGAAARDGPSCLLPAARPGRKSIESLHVILRCRLSPQYRAEDWAKRVRHRPPPRADFTVWTRFFAAFPAKVGRQPQGSRALSLYFNEIKEFLLF